MKSLKVYTILNCKDCKEYHKTLDEVCAQFNITKQLVDVDTDESLEKNLLDMVKYDVRGIPHTIVFDDDKIQSSAQGILTKEQLIKLIYGK